jgi:tripartite-type tricarboxylate transporter receptor subunit TctC
VLTVVRVLATFLTVVCLLGCGDNTAPFPSKEIRIIVQSPPGGLSDQISRFMGLLLEEDLGVPVIAENKPGASGALAFSYVARKSPDGYVIGHTSVELVMVRTLGYTDIGPQDMTLICLAAKIAPVLVVRADAPWQSFEEYVAAARAAPGELIMANSGTGSIWHFNTLLLQSHAKIQVTHLPYNGSGDTLVSLLGGHVDAVIAGVSEAMSHIEAGSLRPLAVFDEKRAAVLPDTPSTHELGYPMGTPAWSAFSGPAGMDPLVRDQIASAFEKASEDPRWLKFSRERGIESAYFGPDKYATFAAEQAEFFAEQIPRLLRMRQ